MLRIYIIYLFSLFVSWWFLNIPRELLLCSKRNRASGENGWKIEIVSKSRVAIQFLVVDCDNAQDVFCIVVSDKWFSRFYFSTLSFSLMLFFALLFQVRRVICCVRLIFYSFSLFLLIWLQSRNFIFNSWRSMWATTRSTNQLNRNQMKNFHLWIIFRKVSRSELPWNIFAIHNSNSNDTSTIQHTFNPVILFGGISCARNNQIYTRFLLLHWK